MLRLQAYTNKPGFLHGLCDRNQFLTVVCQAFFCLSVQPSTATTPVMTLKITCANTEDATGIFAGSLSVVCFVIQLLEAHWHSSFPSILEGQLSQAAQLLRTPVCSAEILTFKIGLIIIRLLQESLEVVQDFLLPQVIKNFLCVVFPGQSFPGKKTNKPLRTSVAQLLPLKSHYILHFTKTNTTSTHLHPDLTVQWHSDICIFCLWRRAMNSILGGEVHCAGPQGPLPAIMIQATPFSFVLGELRESF